MPAHGRGARAPLDDPLNCFPRDSPALGWPFPHLPPLPELQLPLERSHEGPRLPGPSATACPSPTSLPPVPIGLGAAWPLSSRKTPQHLSSHRASRRPPRLLRHRVSMIQLCCTLHVGSITRQIRTTFWRHNVTGHPVPGRPPSTQKAPSWLEPHTPSCQGSLRKTS